MHIGQSFNALLLEIEGGFIQEICKLLDTRIVPGGVYQELLIVIEDDSEVPQPNHSESATPFKDLMDEHLLFKPQFRQDVFALTDQGNSVGTLSALELTSGWLGDAWGLHLNGLWRWWIADTSQVNADALGQWGAWYEF